jgi:RNA polymerase sigma factor (sigma-70 family)
MDPAKKSELDRLVNQFLKGEAELLQPIMELLGGPVYAFLIRLHIPAADAPDVASEFFHSLFDKKIWHYEPRQNSSFWSWLCRVIVNAATDWKKKQGAKNETTASDYLDWSDAQSAWLASPPSERMAPILEAFRQAFSKLSASEQDLMRMKTVLGMEYDQIACSFEPDLEDQARKKFANSLKTKFCRAEKKVWKLMEADSRVPRELFQSESIKGGVVKYESERDNERTPEPTI